MRNVLRYFLLALVLIAVALLSALAAMRLATHGQEVNVPDLRGKSPTEARRVADDAGIIEQTFAAFVGEARHTVDIEICERGSEVAALFQDRQPGEAGLIDLQDEPFEEGAVVRDRAVSTQPQPQQRQRPGRRYDPFADHRLLASRPAHSGRLI